MGIPTIPWLSSGDLLSQPKRASIHVQITTELQADEYGPHEIGTQRFVLPPSFAKDADEAHAKLLTLLVTEDYFELPEHGAVGPVPIGSDTVRRVAVWESSLPAHKDRLRSG